MLAIAGTFVAFAAVGYAAPTSSATAPTISTPAQLTSALSGLKVTDPSYATKYQSIMRAIKPQTPPTNTVDFASKLSSVYAANPSNPLNVAPSILLSGVAGPNDFDDLTAYGICNSVANVNLTPPNKVIYPKASPSDAPYDLSEADLRQAIRLPQGFTFGKKKPVLLVPGSGTTACLDYYTNIYKLLKNTTYADPVFLNIPNELLDDVQVNAEYVAYAINYLNGITSRKASVVTWSAGSITTQWAFKYWPSTRNSTSEKINISADFHGTKLAPLICPPGTPCAPAVLQQFYDSKFVATLRANGGDSAYVPNTSCWSIYDEIVQPQVDPLASARLSDARGVGVTNAQIQTVCNTPTGPASGPNFGHESSLYNAVCFALLNDAVKNGGAADLDRSGAKAQCANFAAPGLDLADILVTESTIPIAGFNIEAYPRKVTTEPPIKSYAAADAPKA